MKTVVIIGGSKGIGKAISNVLLDTCNVVNISRSQPEFTHQNLTHYTCDILTDELPDLEKVDTLIYSQEA